MTPEIRLAALALVLAVAGCAVDPAPEEEVLCDSQEDCAWDEETELWHDAEHTYDLDDELVPAPSAELGLEVDRRSDESGLETQPFMAFAAASDSESWGDEDGGEENPDPQPWKAQEVNPDPQPWKDPYAAATSSGGPSDDREPDPQPW